MKVVPLILFTLSLCFSQAAEPVKHQDGVPREVRKPWISETTEEYGGIYQSLDSGIAGSTRIILTHFHKNGPQVSACMISSEDPVEKPRYQISTLPVDGKNGRLGEWKMIQYIDPNTKAQIFGLEVDGQIFVDLSKTRKK